MSIFFSFMVKKKTLSGLSLDRQLHRPRKEVFSTSPILREGLSGPFRFPEISRDILQVGFLPILRRFGCRDSFPFVVPVVGFISIHIN